MRVSKAKVEAVVSAHEGKRAECGHFPTPDDATVFAAEIVRMMLEKTAYGGTFAVSVSHVHSQRSGQSNFIVAFSGHHPDCLPNRADTTHLLNLDLAEDVHPLAHRARVSYSNTADLAYHPMHVTTQEFLRRAFRKHENITATDVNTQLTTFKNLIWLPPKQVGLGPRLQLFSQFGKKLMPLGAIGLAIRLGVLAPGDEAAVVTSVRRFIRADLKSIKAPPAAVEESQRYQELAKFLEDLLMSRTVNDPEGQSTLLLATQVYAEKSIAAVQKSVVEAWGANALGRFCAEPKGLRYARQSSILAINDLQYGSLQGQLAFWYSYTEHRDFSQKLFIYGQNNDDRAAGHGAYMLPCSSCATRSASMMTGLLPPVVIAAPDPVNMNWMIATEKQIMDRLNALYPHKLDFVSGQVLARAVTEQRRTMASPKPEAFFLEIAKARAVRMSIEL
ncbi:hypothetical protein [Granulicella paludicola]|uniref:hypothetical protein n=1 Tax=Granulicella paludicola TaxID=474951 RepID=UPI0021E0CA92|nr:hypothetical protein [Granulicella paludicola]